MIMEQFPEKYDLSSLCEQNWINFPKIKKHFPFNEAGCRARSALLEKVELWKYFCWKKAAAPCSPDPSLALPVVRDEVDEPFD